MNAENYEDLVNINATLVIVNIKNNDEFITFFIYATQIALKNHREQRLSYLSNTIINYLSLKRSEDEFNLNLLRVLDQLSDFDIIVLFRLQNEGKLQFTLSDTFVLFEANTGNQENFNIQLVDSIKRLTRFNLLDVIIKTPGKGSTESFSIGEVSAKEYFSITVIGQKFINFVG